MNVIDHYGAEIRAINKFVGELDPAVRAEAFRFLLERQCGEQEPKIPTAAQVKAPQTQERTPSPQELLRRIRPSTIFKKATLFGYWLEIHQGLSSFSGSKLTEVFKIAREQPPANPSDVVAKLEQSGRLMRAEKVGKTQHYRLTRTAIEEIEASVNAKEDK